MNLVLTLTLCFKLRSFFALITIVSKLVFRAIAFDNCVFFFFFCISFFLLLPVLVNKRCIYKNRES